MTPRSPVSALFLVPACIVAILLVSGCSSPLFRESSPAPVPTVQVTQAATQTVSTLSASGPQAPVAGSVLASSDKFQYDDNYGKQIVSTSLRSKRIRSEYYYYFNDVSNPVTLLHGADPGTKLLLVGVTFDLVGIHGSGSRTRFMTPLASSFTLWDHGSVLDPVDPHTLDNPLHYYIKDEGSLYIDRWVEKDNPGTGILVFEVPSSFAVKGTFLRFCPENDPSWISLGVAPRSPDAWNCEKDGIAWSLG